MVSRDGTSLRGLRALALRSFPPFTSQSSGFAATSLSGAENRKSVAMCGDSLEGFPRCKRKTMTENPGTGQPN